jgi:MarR family transcriptional regulator, organic hydroperoxide resistance regulator
MSGRRRIEVGEATAEAAAFEVGVATAEAAAFEEFADALTEFFRAARRVRGEAGEAGSRPVSLSQFTVLQTVAEQGDATVGELSQAAGVATPTVTRMLGSLERDGIVERHRDDVDRRVVRIRLTPAGRGLMDEKRAWIAKRQREVYAGLSEADRRAATPLMRRFAALLEEL